MTLTECFTNLCKKLKALVSRVETLEAKPALLSVVNDNGDGTYTHTGSSTGASTVIEVLPSTDACNGIRLGTDSRMFSEDFGYRKVNTWDELKDTIDNGDHALICSTIVASDAHVFDGAGSIYFNPQGELDVNSLDVTINVEIINPSNKRIFLNYVLNENYPDRWKSNGSSIQGTFGGQAARDPRWWGLVTNILPENAPLTEAQLNNNSIAAAALSAPTIKGKQFPIRVVLPQGLIAIHRTVRLDGLLCSLIGVGGEPSSQGGTKLWCENNNYEFETNHYIETAKFPAGTTPVVEVGYERQVTGASPQNPDEGFQCGVQGLAVICPITNIQNNRPVSGIMWESGMQENSKLSQFNVANYSGYGFGGPEYQTLSHNVPDGSDATYPQVNSVVVEEFWLTDPHLDYSDTIPVSMFGSNWEVRNGSIIHVHAVDPLNPVYNTHNQSSVLAGSDTCARLANLHIETSPVTGSTKAAIEIMDQLATPVAQAINASIVIDSVFNWYVGTTVAGLDSVAVWINNTRAAVTCLGIRHRTNNDAPEYAVIADAGTVKRSTGNRASGNGGYVALYSRQFNFVENSYKVQTTDPGLELFGTATFNPSSLLDGAGETTTVTVVGAQLGHTVVASFSLDLQGITVTAWVSAANTVSVRFQNETGGTLDLASGTLKAKII